MLLDYNQVRERLMAVTIGEHAYILAAHHKADLDARIDEVTERIFGDECCHRGAEAPVDEFARHMRRTWLARQQPRQLKPKPREPNILGTAFGFGVTVATFLLPIFVLMALFGR